MKRLSARHELKWISTELDINVGYWYIFFHTSRWQYRANGFVQRDYKKKAIAQHHSLGAYLVCKRKEIKRDIVQKTIVEQILGIWNMREMGTQNSTSDVAPLAVEF